MEDARFIFANRLRVARLASGLTQEALGVAAGIAVDVARMRINRYERGVNECDLRTAKKIADALDLPFAALFADTDEIAELLVAFAELSASEQKNLLKEIKGKAAKG